MKLPTKLVSWGNIIYDYGKRNWEYKHELILLELWHSYMIRAWRLVVKAHESIRESNLREIILLLFTKQQLALPVTSRYEDLDNQICCAHIKYEALGFSEHSNRSSFFSTINKESSTTNLVHQALFSFSDSASVLVFVETQLCLLPIILRDIEAAVNSQWVESFQLLKRSNGRIKGEYLWRCGQAEKWVGF